MTNTPKSGRAALERLADALVEDILEAGDAELLAEASADGEEGTDGARAALRRAAALSRLAENAAALRTSANVRALDPGAARRRLQEFIARDPELAAAAHEEGGLSDEDVYGMLERLQERNAPEPRNRSHDGR